MKSLIEYNLNLGRSRFTYEKPKEYILDSVWGYNFVYILTALLWRLTHQWATYIVIAAHAAHKMF